MLKERLCASAPLLGAAVLALFWPGWPGALCFLLLSAVLLVTALSEFNVLVRRFGYPGTPRLLLLFGLLLLCVAPASAHPEAGGALRVYQLEALLLCLFLVTSWRVAVRASCLRTALLNHVISLGGLIGICWSLSFAAKLYFSAGLAVDGRLLVLFLVAVTKCGDVGAFAVGTFSARRAGGNRPLAPKLSPKKSWEGLFGGIGASVVTAVILVLLFGDRLALDGRPVLDLGRAVLVGAALALLGLAGDLAESALKRGAGAKDSGRVPGLGGVLDILDSLLFTAPIFYLFVTAVSAVGS